MQIKAETVCYIIHINDRRNSTQYTWNPIFNWSASKLQWMNSKLAIWHPKLKGWLNGIDISESGAMGPIIPLPHFNWISRSYQTDSTAKDRNNRLLFHNGSPTVPTFHRNELPRLQIANCQIVIIWHIPHMGRQNRVSIIESHLGTITVPLSRCVQTN